MFSSALLLASLAILTPAATARMCDHAPANSAFDSAAIHDPVEFVGYNFGEDTPNNNCDPSAPSTTSPDAATSASNEIPDPAPESQATPENSPKKPSPSKPPDFNRDIYYKNKFEFSLDGGFLPVNIPLPFDFASGDAYNTYPLKYTLVPIIASLRWHMNNIGGPWFLRGNFDFQFSGSVTAIPRGPESRYLVYIMGMRRNFVQRNSKVAPYFDVRLGMGNIDAKGPIGVYYAQGQDLTFTFNFGSGVRYNFNPRYAISAGVNYMHISNANLSQGNGYTNYGINVLGPMVGLDVQLRRHRN